MTPIFQINRFTEHHMLDKHQWCEVLFLEDFKAVAAFENERDAEEYIRWRMALINARCGQ